jgi:hypothetical protein
MVPVRHGVSTGGNDHIHIAVNLVREDGTKASIHNDYARAQSIALELEEGQLSDEHWAVIAEQFVERMGFRDVISTATERASHSRDAPRPV